MRSELTTNHTNQLGAEDSSGALASAGQSQTSRELLLAQPGTLERLLGQPQTQSYTVARGDTLSKIAQENGVSVDELISLNPAIANPDLIFPGDIVQVPLASQQQYTVVAGDSLTAIANAHGVDLADLIAANPQIRNPNLIHPGDVIDVSGRRVPPELDTSPPAEAAPVPAPAPSPAPAPAPQPGQRFDYNNIVGVEGNANVTPEFIAEVEALAVRLDTQPEHILAVISFETGGTFSPSIRNSIGATGLIQFLPSTARGLGTSTDALAQMSSVEQLRFVEAYWSQPHFSGKLGTIEGLYSAVLSGQAVPNANDTLPNFVQGHRNYAANSGLDFNRDGRVSSGEAASAITSRLYGGVRAVQSQLVEVGAVPANQVAGFADGRFGPQTSAALARFQATQGLPTTGLLDGATGIALFNNAVAAPSAPPAASADGVTDLQLSEAIHERATPARQFIDSPVIGEFILTEGFMARGGPHSSKRATTAIFADNPTVAEPIAAGVYNLGIDYVTTNGRIQTWFDGQVIRVENRTTGYGNRLIMQTDLTFNYQGTNYPVFAHYAHADSFNVTTGERIVAGQDIGDQGSTGHSTGDHVDFLTWIEVNSQRVYISPNLLAGNQS